jgi:hypothetical protein
MNHRLLIFNSTIISIRALLDIGIFFQPAN